jgi:hypothetical protein
MQSDAMHAEAVRLRIKESKLRAGLSIATPPLLLIMGLGVAGVDGPLLVALVCTFLATVLGYVMLWDFPLSIDIDESGIQRNCVLRRDLLEWDDLEGITRARRRGVTAVTKSGKQKILIDRHLDDSETDLLETQAQLRGVKTVL